MGQSKFRLGDLLLRSGLLTTTELDQALQLQAETGEKLGTILVERGMLSEELLLHTLATQLQLPFVELSDYPLKPELAALLPEAYARRCQAILLDVDEHATTVAMAEPQDIVARDILANVLPDKIIHPVLVKPKELQNALDTLYRRQSEITGWADALADTLIEQSGSDDNPFAEGDAADSPVAKLLHSLFTDAIQVRASDIHIEPNAARLRLRLRVDGLLQEQIIENRNIAPALAQRLKLMAKLNIAERRLPQDGRFQMTIRGKRIDVRLSTLPTQFGESVVMRLLSLDMKQSSFEKQGMPAELISRFQKMIRLPHGMILVTGPTGSGKTTTLYTALSELNVPDRKIITIEDPIEYQMERICQVPINAAIDLTFSRVLRSALRQDPDILLVGEIRDKETATIALRAALTGHLVFATLHTNNTTTAPLRLIDMGVESYLVAVAVRAILSQRLVRCVCPHCTQDHTLDADETAFMQPFSTEEIVHYQRGAGCSHCHETGFYDRVGVYEWLEMTPEMMQALQQSDQAQFAAVARQSLKQHTLLHSAAKLAATGQTTVSEAIRIGAEG